MSIAKEKQKLAAAVEKREEKFWHISDSIWKYAELGFEEYKSSKLLTDTLESYGFHIDLGVAEIPTAFVATWSQGSGGPVVGLMTEYDALPNLSQKPGQPTREPLIPGAPGHGCNHNTPGPMQSLAAVALAEILGVSGENFTIKVFGCPAEELAVSRPFMIKAGLFDDVDVVIDCQGDVDFKAIYGKIGAALFSFQIEFTGKEAHAGVVPWSGRSAVDAVELMHAGTERMREHIPPNMRMSWSNSYRDHVPGIVPAEATTWYYVRGQDADVKKLSEWVIDCARGAALMTQTTFKTKFMGAVHQRIYNKAMAELFFENIELVGRPTYSDDEEAYARAIQKTEGYPIKGMEYPLDFVCTEKGRWASALGANDVGDVCQLIPTGCIRYPAVVPGSLFHEWPVTSAGATSIAHKGITAGAKTVAFTIYDLLKDPLRLAKIKEEFDRFAEKHPYEAFIPSDAKPLVGLWKETMAKYRPELEKLL